MSYESIILLAAKKVGVSGALLLAICTHESGLKNTMVPSDGHSSTYGICMVKLETAQMLGYKGDSSGLMVPDVNARWAAEYLKYQSDRYSGDGCKTVAAYNAGRFNESPSLPGRPRNLRYVREVQKHMANELKGSISCEPEIADQDLSGYIGRSK